MGNQLHICTRSKPDEISFVILRVIFGSFFWQGDSGQKISFELLSKVDYSEILDILPLATLKCLSVGCQCDASYDNV